MGDKNQPKSFRHAALLELAEARGYVRLTEASVHLGVSEQTVRRDVRQLDKQGKVRRTHGGFAFLGTLNNMAFAQRQMAQPAEKAKIARNIAELVPDGACIFLDTGSTCEAVAKALLVRKSLRVVTYGIRAALHFSDRQDYTVTIPGGIVRPFDGSIVGVQTDNFIEQFKFEYAIIAVSGFDKTGCLTDDDAFEVERVRSALTRATETILALTSEKIGVTALMKLAEFEEVDHAVVDGISNPQLESLAKANDVNLIFAE